MASVVVRPSWWTVAFFAQCTEEEYYTEAWDVSTEGDIVVTTKGKEVDSASCNK